MTENKTQHSERPVLAALLMMGAFSLIPLSDGIAKNLTASFSPWEVAFGRFAAHFLWMAPFVIFYHRAKLIREYHPREQIIRGLLLAASVVLIILAFSVIPQARAIALQMFSPFIVALLSFVILGERVRPVHFVYIAGGFCGVMLIVRPDIGLEWHNILAIISGVFFALFVIVSRKFTPVPPEVGSFYVAMTGAVALFPLIFFIETKPLTISDIAGFTMMGGCIALAYYFMVLAFKYAKAAFLALFQYWEIAMAVIVGWIFHGDIPDSHEWLGIAVIVFCGMMMILHGKKRTK